MNQDTKEQFGIIIHLVKELVGIYRGAISQFGISENEFWIWYTLIIMKGEYSQQDICSTWSLSKQTVNTIIMRMVQKNLAYLEMIPGTRNRKNICLTETGKEYGELIVRPVSDAEQRTLSRLSVKDCNACTAVLEGYIRILKEEMYGTENRHYLQI